MSIIDLNTEEYITNEVSNNEPKISVASEILGMNLEKGETETTAVDLNGKFPRFLHLPTGFTGTTITFEASIDAVTYMPVYTAANVEVSVTVAETRVYCLPESLWGVSYLKVISGSAQAADITLYLQT